MITPSSTSSPGNSAKSTRSSEEPPTACAGGVGLVVRMFWPYHLAMQLSALARNRLGGLFETYKAPTSSESPAQRNPEVPRRVLEC